MPEIKKRSTQLNSSDADDVYLDAKSRFEIWQQEFDVAWYKPQVDLAKKMLWNSQPEAVKQQLRQRVPVGTKNLDNLVIGKEGKNGK